MNSEYRGLLMDIADEVTLKELARMKFMCADILPDVKPDDNSGELLLEVFNFLLELEKQNILSVNNLDKLKFLLEKAKRKDLVAKVENFQSKSKDDNCSTSPPSALSPSGSIRPEVSKQHTLEIETIEGRIARPIDNGQHSTVSKSVENPIAEVEDKAKDRKRKKRAKYKQKKKAEKQSASSTPEAAGDNVVSESTVCITSQEDQMLTETNNNNVSVVSSSSVIPSDLKPENVVEPVSAHKEHIMREDSPPNLFLPPHEEKFIKEEEATENQAKVMKKEHVQIRKGEMPRNGQGEGKKEIPSATNEHIQVVEDPKKGKESVQEKEIPHDNLNQEKKKIRVEGILPTTNNVDKTGEDQVDVCEKEKTVKKIPSAPKKDGGAKEVLMSSAKEAVEGLTSVKEQSKQKSGAATFQRRYILSLCSRWQDWGESIPVMNRELCLALARAGHRVTCLVLTSSDFDKEDARKGNVELIQCTDKPGIKRDDPQLLYHGQQVDFLPDLVIGHGKLTGPASVFHADNASCPRLHVIHDLPAECLKFDNPAEQECNEEQLAKNADFVAVIGSLLKEKWSALINRDVIELIPGLPELTTRNRIPSPQCRCLVPAKFSAPFASGLRLAVKTVNCSSKRESPPRKTTLIACNTDSSGSVKPAKKVLKLVDKRLVDLNERPGINIQDAHYDIQGATVFLSPARVEAFGVAALDAIAIGIPIVISTHSGLAHTIRQYFHEKFHSCIKDILLHPEEARDEAEEDEDAQVWAISIDKISVRRDEAFDLASDLRSEWKKKFTWDAAVRELMHFITESGKLPLRSPRPVLNSTLISREVPESCRNLVKQLNLFDRRQKFVLFLSPEDPQFLQNAVHLGLVQWAAVFDFDRESTTKGYLKSCEGLMENTGKPACRMLPPHKEDIGKENQNFTLPNGIPWILLQGIPDMERDVDRNLDWIQEIFHHLRKRHSTNITLLILWNSANENKHLCKKLYQIQLQVQASPHWKNAVQLVLLSTSDNVDSRLYEIAEEWSVKIEKVNLNQFCNALYSSATANPLYKLDPDFSLPKRQANAMQCDRAPSTLPSSMRWVDSVVEVLYTSIGLTPEFGKDDAHYFYRGGKISWYGIEMDYAVERESWEPLRNIIEGEMEYPGATFLTLFHQRGTGGTTSARKLLYDFHLRYPCVCLKTINYETFLAIKEIWEFCSLPVIILADIKEFPGAEDNDVEALYGNLSNEKVSCLILHIVHRHYQAEPKREKEPNPNPKELVLAKPLTDKERKNFIKVYSLQSPTKKSELGKMKNADEQLQIPFYYGLVAFGEQFKGLEPFVADCLRGLNERQRKALCFLSVAHHYGQLELNSSAFAGVFNLKPRQLHSIGDVLTPESIELLIEEYGCWRPRHCTIGKEILRQLLTVPYNIHPGNWPRNLADKAIEFISYMEEENTKAVLLNRISDEKTYKRFSSLVEDIPEDEDVVKVFEKAIAVHPCNPFFKAHLGRYYSVKRGHEGFGLALEYTDNGILLASGMSRNIRSQLMQMKGMIFKRQVKNQIEKSAKLGDIISLAKDGVAAFTRAASICPDRLENCYIPQVRMMCDIFKYIHKDANGGIFKYLHSKDADPFILDGISESSDILETVSESIYYPDLRRDLFMLGGFGRRSADKKDLIQHFKELKKTSRTSTASINRQIVLLQLELCKENNKPISEVAEELNHLLEESLKYDKKIDLTMRLWVRVAPHIPVDLQAAESKMATWCNQGKSALSYLYRYIFTCIHILEGGRDQRFEDERKIARDELRKTVHSTKRLSLLHPDRPVLFLGSSKGMGQLVTVEESVTNVRKQRLIPESLTKRLRRFTGIITKTGKVGQIKADGLTVSFRADLCQPPLIGESYLAKKVSFYLAFTYFEADAYNVRIMAE